MPIADDAAFERRQWGWGGGTSNRTPWWCSFWPSACATSTGGGSTPTSTRRQTSTAKPPINSPTSTAPRTTVPQPAPPVATQPPAAPPAATQSSNPPPQPQPQPAPSPTSQTRVPPPMPPPTNTERPGALTTSVSPVAVQPGGSSGNSTGDGNGWPTQGGESGAGTGKGDEGPGPTGASGTGNPPAQSAVPPASTPSTSNTPGIDGGDAATGSGGSSGGGLPPGAIAGIVVGLLLLLALLGLLLYRFRRSPVVQRMLAPLSKLGGGLGGFSRVDTPGGDGMDRNLITPSPVAAATAGGSAAAAVTTSNRGHHPPPSQPPMRQTGHLHPLSIPAAAAARDSNRVSVFTYDSVATTGFTPSPVSPMSPSTMLSPGTVRTSRPIQEPPDPRIIASANARMAWPMPPGPSPAIQHPDGPQYLNFQQSGETVVRINQPPRSNRRSGGY
ncbi:hypothetical protein C8A01DRAFT_47985 [Parachaetomium inaequale]|uniref:Uncharacterized protein n=1 Tax=Parachaetomium inaequale TaxID=2588326 RepID=A0AAN6PCM7_9PEZI|nr:hypothetical protein C8A01DRAFT_47985 [Parachaetomium inaequale]